MPAFPCSFAPFLLLTYLNFYSGLCRKEVEGSYNYDSATRPERKGLEIIIGGGGNVPSPPDPKECPPPPSPPKPECPPPPRLHSPPPPSPPPPPPPPRPPPPSPFLSDVLERDYYTIKKFAKLIEHDPHGYKKTWKGKDICKWKGFFCEKLPDKKNQFALAAIDFNPANFSGTNLRLDNFLEKLDDLAIFHANSNFFKGTIPKDVLKLRFMYELDVSNNRLSGEFPMGLLSAKNLTFLDLRYNNFEGVVPSGAYNLDLDVLFLNNNNFAHELPDNIGNTSALFLTFANNNFTGQIPPSIGRAKKLLQVLFLNNKLSGCLPYEIGYLKKTTVFDAERNKLTGPIPYSFGCLEEMKQLNFACNEMYGTVPEIVCQLPNIANLSLSENYFTEVGPECRKLIEKKRLDVRKNCILGLRDQRPGAECDAFFSKTRYCPNPESMKWMPCKGKNYKSNPVGTTSNEPQERTGPASSSLIYAPLRPHRL